MTRSYKPTPSNAEDKAIEHEQHEQIIEAAVAVSHQAAADENDTSFEIDEPEDEELDAEIQILSNSMSTPTNEPRLSNSESLPSTSKARTNTSPPQNAYSSSYHQAIRSDSEGDEQSLSSSYGDESHTCSSTPTTADVADVTAVPVYPGSNRFGSSLTKRILSPPLIQTIAIHHHQHQHQAINMTSTDTGSITTAASLADDNYSGSLATNTTTTDLDIDNIPSTSPYNNYNSRRVSPATPILPRTHSSNQATILKANASIHAMPSAATGATTATLLTHPSAAFQETDSAQNSSNINGDLLATQFNASSMSSKRSSTAMHQHHQRNLSSASYRSITSQHSAHTTTMSVTQPNSRIWASLHRLCKWFKSSGIGEPSVYHGLVVIFLEYFAWGLLTMPLIAVLNQTFPDHTFLMNGLVMGIKGILSFLSAPLIGALSDIWGRKFFLLITVFFTCAPIPLMTINSWWFFAMISISGIFAVTFSVVFAYVADVTTVEERSKAYGLVSATFAASMVISPTLGTVLMERYSDTLVVALATAIAVLDVFFILVAVPESLPDKVRPSTWGAPINWEQADPFAALRKVSTDHTILMECVTVLLSYLPEAAEYSCLFVYLKLKMGFATSEVSIFIAVVGILSISVQVTLGYLMRTIGAKRTIVLGLILEMTQLFWFGFASQKWMMWAAGILAALGSITYPAISAFVSIHSTPDSQGAVQGMVTGMRGLCNGVGPALFGLIFYLFNVDLNNEQSISGTHPAGDNATSHDKWFQVPGPPFVFGGFMVILAILVALFIPAAHGNELFSQKTPKGDCKKRLSIDVQYEIEGGHKPTSPLMRSDSLAQL